MTANYNKTKKIISILTILSLVLTTVFVAPIFTSNYEIYATTNDKQGVVSNLSGANFRNGPSTSGTTIYALLPYNTEVTIKNYVDGQEWYQVEYNNKEGYIWAPLITVLNEVPYEYDEEFEKHLTAEGFPESYKVELRKLYAKYPQWKFYSIDTGVSWSTALGKQVNSSTTGRVGTSLIHSSFPESYRSYNNGTYDFTNDKYKTADGGWYYASDEIVAFYFDPRNNLTETTVFQFMGQRFDGSTQSAATVKAIADGTFVETRKTSKNENLYDVIYQAGAAAGVNPNVLASMIIQEQGTNGSSDLISGTYSSYGGIYRGYYNFFNIGAYNASGFSSAVHRGLWYAAGSGEGYTGYNRPWKTVGSESGEYRSIVGGAEFYAEEYINNNQYTLYLKKFNVANGASDMGTHQYMTSISSGQSEGVILQEAYDDNMNMPISFYIPVYDNMPESASPAPSRVGNNNNLLDSVTLKTGSTTLSLGSSFDRYDQSYSTSTDSGFVTISAKANESGATISGTGTYELKNGKNTFNVVVTSTSGLKRTYTINITSSYVEEEYEVGEYITNVREKTSIDDFKEKIIKVTENANTVTVLDNDGEEVKSGYVGTGMSVSVKNSSGTTLIEKPILIMGDASGDGKISSLDYILIKNHIMEVKVMTGIYVEAADISGDGNVKSIDYIHVKNHIMGDSIIR